ncbi:MAG TPA: amidase family protein [Pseudonocardia sp.]|nr:amidase family protein [Pseudonocardia sp.]
MTPAGLDGVELGRMLADGRLDAPALAAEAVAGAERAPEVFLGVTAGRAAREAEAGRARRRAGRPRSPLDGVPVAWKDMFDIAGKVTTAGSPQRRALPPAAADAALVARLADAGAVCVGATNLSEFAFGGLGVNPHFGTPTRNGPDGHALVPGGSSSGAAMAVHLGIVPIALGTDTSGSVRVPATFCGLVGYEASERRYPQDGMLALSATLDSVGIIATSVRDVLATDALLTATAPAPRPHPPPRLVVPEGELVEDCTPDVRREFARSVSLLSEHGVRVETRRVPVLEMAQDLMDRHGTIVEADAHHRYGHLLDTPRPGDVDPGVLRRLRAARRDVQPVRRARATLRRRLATELGGALLACPAVRHVPPALAPLLADDALYDRTNRRTLRTTMLLSYLGMPGVTLPVGSRPGRDVGLLISAPAGRDPDLLRSAGIVEQLLQPAARRVRNGRRQGA